MINLYTGADQGLQIQAMKNSQPLNLESYLRVILFLKTYGGDIIELDGTIDDDTSGKVYFAFTSERSTNKKGKYIAELWGITNEGKKIHIGDDEIVFNSVIKIPDG